MAGRSENAKKLAAKREAEEALNPDADKSILEAVKDSVVDTVVDTAKATGIGLDESQEKLMQNDIVKALDAAHPDMMREVFLAGADGAAAVIEKHMSDTAFRKTAVDAVLEDPSDLQGLIQDSGMTNPELSALSGLLDNKVVLHVLHAADENRQIAYDLANPANAGNIETVLGKYMNDKDVMQDVMDAVAGNRADAVALQSVVNNPKFDQLLQKDTAEIKEISKKMEKGQSVTEAVTSTMVDPIVTLAAAKDNPDAHVQAGEKFVDLIAENVSVNGAAQANIEWMKRKPSLMGDIGADFAEHGPEIKKMLNDAISSGDMSGAFEEMLSKYPEMAEVAVPIMAAADPAGVSKQVMSGMKEGLLETVKDLKGQEKIDAEAYINESVADLAGNPRFMENLQNSLSDPQMAGALLGNLKQVNSLGGSGGVDGMKVVLEDAKNNPDAFFDIVTSEQMMSRAGERWGAGMLSAKMDGFMQGLDTFFADFANSEMGQMLSGFGIDVGGLSNSLSGFMGQIQQMAGPMVAQISNTATRYQMAGGIMKAAGQNLVDMGLEEKGETFVMNSKDGKSMFGQISQQLGDGYDKVTTLADMSRGKSQGWANDQARSLSARVVTNEDGSRTFVMMGKDGKLIKQDLVDTSKPIDASQQVGTPTMVAENNLDELSPAVNV